MIKIIKHGHAQYKATCKYCECIFSFEDSDIQNNGCQWDWCEWIICPECHRQNDISSRSAFKFHQFQD